MRSILLAGGAVLAFAPAGIAQAQEAAADDRVVVTGSRIARTGMTTPTPVTTVSSTELQQIAPGNLVEVFNALPQFIGNASPQTAGNLASSAGASNLNMRGLDSKRSLVLLDGRRVVSSNRLGTIDISVFPEAVLERVEVVTGGASAAYGTDAVAGVTNFILNTDFEGIEIYGQAGITDRNDNENFEGGVTFGGEVANNLHVIGSLEYSASAEVRSLTSRDWYTGWGYVTNPAWLASPANARVGPQFVTANNVVSTNASAGGILRLNPNAPGGGTRYIFNEDGTYSPFVFSSLAAYQSGTSGSQSIDPAFGGGSGTQARADPDRKAAGSVVPETERATLYSYVDYDVAPNFNVFLQGIYGDSRVLQRGGTTVLEGNWGGTVFADNAYLPDAIRTEMQGRGLTSAQFWRTHGSMDLAQGTLEQTNRMLSITPGFQYTVESGGLFDNWVVDGYYQYGRNKNHIALGQFVRTDRLFKAMDAVRSPITGEIVCNVTLYTGEYCAPINLFGAGQASDAALDYVLGSDRPVKDIRATVRQDFSEVSASGEVWDGFGAGAVSLAFGASYRKDSFDQIVGPGNFDTLTVSPVNNPALGIRGIPGGFLDRPVHQFSTAYPIAGSFTVKEVFAETLIPLISDVTLIESLETSLAARYADYSGSGGIWAWKAGLDWSVTQDFRLRGTLSRDVRAGTLAERFDQQGNGTTAEDPFMGNQRFSFSQIQGGNPNIQPEVADTLTVGGVYQPSWLPGFAVSVDYYDIDLAGAIDLLGVQRIIDDCFAGATELCGLIERNDDGTLKLVQNIYQNIDAMRVNGVDVEFSYRTNINVLGGGEALNLRLLASFLNENSTENAGAAPIDAAGQPPYFEERFTANASYVNGPWTVFLQGRFYGEALRNATWEEGVDIDFNDIDSRFYTDLRVSYDLERNNGMSWELFANVQNLFDVDPPLAPSFSSGFSGAVQTNESYYDVLGRRYTAGVRLRY